MKNHLKNECESVLERKKSTKKPENETVPEELKPSEPKAKKGKKIAKNTPEKKGIKKNVVAEEAIKDVDTN